MNTITIQHADKKVTSVFKQMAEVLGVSFEAKKEKEVKYNPTLLKTIEDYKSGKMKGIVFTDKMRKQLLNEAK